MHESLRIGKRTSLNIKISKTPDISEIYHNFRVDPLPRDNTFDPGLRMAGTFLTARSCIQAHQLFEDMLEEAADEAVGEEVASTRGLERMRCVKQPTGDRNKDEAKEEEEQRDRLLDDPMKRPK